MKCVICKQATIRPGKATVTLERGPTTLVFKAVPARICPNCGEEYVDEKTTSRLLESAERAADSGVQVVVRQYASARGPRPLGSRLLRTPQVRPRK